MHVYTDEVQSKPVRLIVATCKNMGIGKNGQLPWNLPKEFAFFLNMISSVSSPDHKNLLIWGRKCWETFPENLLPLANCVNAVLSRNLSSVPRHAQYLCRNLPNAIRLGSTLPLSEDIEIIWIIGGVKPYKEALMHPWCDLLYITKIMASFDCDTFFPSFDHEVFRKVDKFSGVPSEIQEENGIKFKHQVFQRKQK
ncbi:zgc:153031 [Erpetoichthys calabaricus]|uniref:dihydrofolate reductase n=1 Tax=Erpetoichthys calabaricus TaxID=27687 RepID=A0A8C4RYY9_ERPCA|nr:zgc:153031 [Erpetoichthys calabaricus]